MVHGIQAVIGLDEIPAATILDIHGQIAKKGILPYKANSNIDADLKDNKAPRIPPNFCVVKLKNTAGVVAVNVLDLMNPKTQINIGDMFNYKVINITYTDNLLRGDNIYLLLQAAISDFCSSSKVTTGKGGNANYSKNSELSRIASLPIEDFRRFCIDLSGYREKERIYKLIEDGDIEALMKQDPEKLDNSLDFVGENTKICKDWNIQNRGTLTLVRWNLSLILNFKLRLITEHSMKEGVFITLPALTNLLLEKIKSYEK